MDDALPFWLLAAIIGTGATMVMDLWGQIQKHAYDTPPLDYGLVGRWLGYMARGRFSHPSIAAAPALPGEKWLGWIAHYVIGVVFAASLLMICGLRWAVMPTIGPALVVGLATVVMPFFIMQPAMGLGIAASRTPNPMAARLRSLVSHGVFGLGLYLAAVLFAAIFIASGKI